MLVENLEVIMSIFTGASTALVTPFLEDGSLDIQGLKDLIEFQIQEGIDSITVCGTTGESATLNEEEYKTIIETSLKQVNGRIPVIAGAGSNNTAHGCQLAQVAVALGVDALLVVTPYYNKATQEGLVKHFTTIANVSQNTPIILYNVPGRTGCNIAPATVAKLFKNVENIVAIKEASGDISQVAQIMKLTEGKIDLYSGNDDQITPVLSLGGKGVISVLSNIAPAKTHEICEAYFQGEVGKSCALQLEYLGLIDEIFSEVNPIPIKKALNLMGIKVGGLRLPLTELSIHNEKQLKEQMERLKLL